MHINIKNRKATFEYEILSKFIAGISLLGTEKLNQSEIIKLIFLMHTVFLITMNYMLKTYIFQNIQIVVM